ncbi:GvpL/GvpF family gas vesicle protein [Brevibacillus dissolubilis]|uniref:GvpL/GvpF family gas vesicle protein n=1 Tax=Brevibacillus dissolubilis TaxID=1844116 RepID=UPI001115B5C0|nr:GvpL/GvpF family gas vesicle protein [Brevibacillus dissolubilis]
MSGYIYVYGLIPVEETAAKPVPVFTGVDAKYHSYTVKESGIVAVVSRVDADAYSPAKVEKNLKNSAWLEEKAFHHHDCICLINKEFTVLPLSFCTIFASEDKLKRSLRDRADTLHAKISAITGKQEWNVKTYCDNKQWETYIEQNHPDVERLRKEIAAMSPDRQFLMKQKLSQQIAQAVSMERDRCWKTIHQHLEERSVGSCVRRTYGKEITGRGDEMIGNVDYLVSANQIQRFQEGIRQFGERTGAGWALEVTGPWPPYHFAMLHKEEIMNGTESAQ